MVPPNMRAKDENVADKRRNAAKLLAGPGGLAPSGYGL